VVKPDALKEKALMDVKLRRPKTAYPRPRPATYDAGAGMDKNASLFGLFDAMLLSYFRSYRLIVICKKFQPSKADEMVPERVIAKATLSLIKIVALSGQFPKSKSSRHPELVVVKRIANGVRVKGT
jgi:hypothetical protein